MCLCLSIDMWVTIISVFAIVVAVSASPVNPKEDGQSRIIGGTVTAINNYPYAVATMYEIVASSSVFQQWCAGSILNQRSILTAAHCPYQSGMSPFRWRGRVGSSFASSGGSVHQVSEIMLHPQYNPTNQDNDFCILRVTEFFEYSNLVGPATIAGPNYNLLDNEAVWAIGWGVTEMGSYSEQLRHVQVWSINQNICRQRYPFLTDNMLCSGWLDVGGRDQCQNDSGGPLLHNNVIVGLCSWGYGCADPFFPGVNARISSASNWISANA